MAKTFTTHSIDPVIKGDTVPKVTLTIRNKDGILVDFSGATFCAELRRDARSTVFKTLNITSSGLGILEVAEWTADIGAYLYRTHIKVTFPDGDKRTVAELVYQIEDTYTEC